MPSLNAASRHSTAAEGLAADPCSCGCTDPHGAGVHPLCAALANGDVDRAFALGLLKAMPCPACSIECQVALVQARIERKHALAARERHRARDTRLQRRRDERARRRGASQPGDPTASEPTGPSTPDQAATAPRPALPAAVAAALARAKAKAAATPPPAGPKP